MSETSKKRPRRNAPCPCGSGKKYKHCCRNLVTFDEEGGHEAGDAGEQGERRRWLGLSLAIGLFLFSLFVLAGTVVPLIRPSGQFIGSSPDPWHYDAANDRHWHPGHNHWHDGPPPLEHRDPEQVQPAPAPTDHASPGTGATPAPSGMPDTPGATDTPEPWEYDAANDRHWHPGHGHWHRGPPPAGVRNE